MNRTQQSAIADGEFGWLRDEIKAINTRRFHLVGQEVTPDSPDLGPLFGHPLPVSYERFLEEFGGARLYSDRDAHRLNVYSLPAVRHAADDEFALIAGFEKFRIYFEKSECREGVDHVWRRHARPGSKTIPTRMTFAEWLRRACTSTRRSYRSKWKQILAGPPPFSEIEREVVEAREKFTWTFRGVGDDGEHKILVRNGSTRSLPFLTLGWKMVDPHKTFYRSRLWLPVSDVAPGDESMISKKCYTPANSRPEEFEPFPLPPPEPEERGLYWEFRGLE